ncbi:MAG: outer membrane beta-barrel protein [Longimicrobiales bacterium]|nr:outer membrane beta-barrel protein [Longimicrobiales bacterium]
MSPLTVPSEESTMKYRSFLKVAAVVLAAVVWVRPAAAQQAGTITVSAFGQFSFFEDATTLSETPAAGIGIGASYFVINNLAVELSGAWVPTELAEQGGDDVDLYPLRALAAYHFPVSGDVVPIIGGGYTRLEYSDGIDESDNALTGLLGVKVYFSDRVAFRLDGMVDYVPSPFNEDQGVGSHLNAALTAGVSWDVGGRGR